MFDLILTFSGDSPQALGRVWARFFCISNLPQHYYSCGVHLFSSAHALNNHDFPGRMLSWHYSSPSQFMLLSTGHIGVAHAEVLALTYLFDLAKTLISSLPFAA